jgi:hypothetical protein
MHMQQHMGTVATRFMMLGYGCNASDAKRGPER